MPQRNHQIEEQLTHLVATQRDQPEDQVTDTKNGNLSAPAHHPRRQKLTKSMGAVALRRTA